MSRLTQAHMNLFLESNANGQKSHVASNLETERLTYSEWAQGDFDFSTEPLDFHFIELCKSGLHRGVMEAEREDDSTEFISQVGMINYVKPDTEVRLTVEGETYNQQLWIDKGLFADVAQELCRGDPDRTETLGFVGVYDPMIARSFAIIEREGVANEAGGQIIADAAAMQVAVAIMRRNLGSNARTPAIKALSQETIKRIFDYCVDNLERGVTLNEMATIAGMSRYYFSHTFQKTTGETPQSFFINLRIERAKTLLAKTAEPIAEIAYACGFSSQAHLTNLFSKRIGATPAKYRKALQT